MEPPHFIQEKIKDYNMLRQDLHRFKIRFMDYLEKSKATTTTIHSRPMILRRKGQGY